MSLSHAITTIWNSDKHNGTQQYIVRGWPGLWRFLPFVIVGVVFMVAGMLARLGVIFLAEQVTEVFGLHHPMLQFLLSLITGRVIWSFLFIVGLGALLLICLVATLNQKIIWFKDGKMYHRCRLLGVCLMREIPCDRIKAVRYKKSGSQNGKAFYRVDAFHTAGMWEKMQARPGMWQLNLAEEIPSKEEAQWFTTEIQTQVNQAQQASSAHSLRPNIDVKVEQVLPLITAFIGGSVLLIILGYLLF